MIASEFFCGAAENFSEERKEELLRLN